MSNPTDSALGKRLVSARSLTDILRGAGTLPRGSITSLAITRQIRTDISNLVFVAVTYSHDARALPSRLLLKWPLREVPIPGGDEAEPNFYRELAPSLPSPPIVKCLAIAAASSAPQWILLEDLRETHTNPPWPLAPAAAHVENAVAVLAQVHAHWWESPTLGRTVGTVHTDSGLRRMVQGFAAKLPGFLDALGDTVSTDDREMLERVFTSSLAPWLRLLDPRALTVVHGDAHTWNFLFPRAGHDPPYLIDWQVWHVDLGVRDLAFMITLHWDAARRREFELHLLRHYHRRLVAGGVTDYAFADVLLDYRRCAIRNLTFPIILWSRGMREEAWRQRLTNAIASYRDLHCAELL